jgi:hypothetical protein
MLGIHENEVLMAMQTSLHQSGSRDQRFPVQQHSPLGCHPFDKMLLAYLFRI